MERSTRRLAASGALVIILGVLVALAPNRWWAAAVFVVVIPAVFASLIWAAGQKLTPAAVVIGSVAMMAAVAVYVILAVSMSRLIGPVAWFVVPLAAAAGGVVVRRRATARVVGDSSPIGPG